MVRAISLFSGCGGSDLGLRDLGVDVVWANDRWKPACDAYRLVMPGVDLHEGDVRDIDHLPAAELLVGCYPCQGFSQGGRREPHDGINFLFLEFGWALHKVRPLAFIVENVIGMTFGRNREMLECQKRLFQRAGYVVEDYVVDARDHGLAQERKRVFLIGVRRGLGVEYLPPEPSHGPKSGKPWRGQEKDLAGFPLWPDGGYNTQPFSWYYLSRRRRRDWSEPAPCVVGRAPNVALHPCSPPLEYVGPDAYRFTSDAPARRYTYLECAALQGFPDKPIWPDSKYSVATLHQIIGNAVPPPLMRAVARPLVNVLA